MDEARYRMRVQLAASGDRTAILVGGIFFVVGLALLGGAVWSGDSQYAILKTWVKTDATVIESTLTKGRDSQNSTMYGTEFEFRYTVNGKEYQTPASSSYQSSSYVEMKRKVDAFAQGTQHPILYNPADPNDIRFDAGYSFGFFLLPVILGGMGLVFTAVGGGIWIGFRSPAAGFLCPACHKPIERNQEFCPHCATLLSSN